MDIRESRDNARCYEIEVNAEEITNSKDIIITEMMSHISRLGGNPEKKTLLDCPEKFNGNPIPIAIRKVVQYYV